MEMSKKDTKTMKKIFIFSQAMEIGGAERALLGLLENIDTTKYEVDLFLMHCSGDLFKYIPDKINILNEISDYAQLAVPVTTNFKFGELRIAFGRILGKIKAMKYAKKNNIAQPHAIQDDYSHKFTYKYLPKISDKEYDLAISFLAPHYIVNKNIVAKKKIAWIHTDYETIDIDVESELSIWKKYDNIISISQTVTDSFIKKLPTLKDKIILIENIMPTKYMQSLLDEFSVEEEMPSSDATKILSVGRFCLAKNFDNVPEICKKIRERGLNVIWYLIGYGQDEQLIRNKIAEYGMQKYVKILGKKENPYPYFSACDIYVQPSRFEGKCVSVIEAQMLHKPVIITDYATSKCQLKDGIDGVVVPMDNDGCAQGICNVLKNEELMQNLSLNCSKNNYTNLSEIEKFYDLIEN